MATTSDQELCVENLCTVKILAKRYSDFLTEGGIRWTIFNRSRQLEAAGALYRRGRKILLDDKRYIKAILTQPPAEKQVERTAKAGTAARKAA